MSSAETYKAGLLEWLRHAVDEGWIPKEEILALETMESHGADRLFEEGAGRPLTVGIFGGTGVGKSSLLNRLVGEPVAAVGVERPTSTEVTVYVHRHYPIRRLDELFPVDRVRVLSHDQDEYRDVVWIDMPDIDSIERSNRDLVFEWLPYIDWLIYVVSPERYRDDEGWQVLKRRGHRHNWLFVMNHWDTASADQLADFKSLLVHEGFDESRVLKTSCGERVDDDFAAVSGTINGAVKEYGLALLQQVGERARLADLDERREGYAATLGSETQWRAFINRGKSALQGKLAELHAYMKDEANIEAAHIPDRPSSEASAIHEPPVPVLVPQYIQDLRSVVSVVVDDLPANPVKERTRAITASLEDRLVTAFQRSFRDGVARPGTALQRAVVKAMRKLVYGLPLLVGVGMAYIVITRYRHGLDGAEEFLGANFLFHSLMVLGLSALLPYLLARLLRPSVRRSVVKRVERRSRQLNDEVLREWTGAIEKLSLRAGDLRKALDETSRSAN